MVGTGRMGRCGELKVFPDLDQAATDPCFHAAEGESGGIGDFLMGEALVEVELEEVLGVLGQGLESAFEGIVIDGGWVVGWGGWREIEVIEGFRGR